MASVTTFRILISLLWILFGVWFQTSGLVGESSGNKHTGNNNKTTGQVTAEDHNFAKDNLDTFYEYAEPGSNTEIKSEQPRVENINGDEFRNEWIPEYDDPLVNMNITLEEVTSTIEITPEQSYYAPTAQSQASVVATSAPTKSYQWEEEKYLSLGLNPKIEVSIEILHNDTTVRSKPTSNPTGTPAEPFDESPISVTTVSVASEKISTTTMPGISRDLGLLPFAIQSLDKDIHATRNAGGTEAEEDICERWIHCPGEHLLSDLARLNDLPNCPCMYSFDIHYKDEIWDGQKRHNYRWRDASGPNDHLDIFHAGAKWCIRSLISDGSSSSMAAQQCCYDHKRHLITRGNGAGTPYAISPEVSRELHHKADVIPWIICKGDWTRYHIRRSPNNGLNCRQNPSDNVYFKQIQKAKNYR